MKYTILETTIGALTHTRKLENSLQQALILGNLSNKTYNLETAPLKPVFIQGQDSYEANIPLLKYPTPVTQGSTQYLCIDARPFLKKNQALVLGEDNRDKYSNYEGLKLQIYHAIFAQYWHESKYDVLRLASPMVTGVFTQWITRAITNKYGLNPLDEVKVAACVYAYINAQFDLQAGDEHRLAIAFKNTYAIDLRVIKPVFDAIGTIDTLDNLCTQITNTADNINLKSLDTATLINLTSNFWYGYEASTTLACALEYPPIWLAVLAVTTQSTLYSNTRLFTLIKNSSRKYNLAEFNKRVGLLVDKKTKEG